MLSWEDEVEMWRRHVMSMGREDGEDLRDVALDGLCVAHHLARAWEAGRQCLERTRVRLRKIRRRALERDRDLL